MPAQGRLCSITWTAVPNKWWLIRDTAGTSSAVPALQLQQICKGNSDRQVVHTFGRRSKEHHNFLISLFYLPKVGGTGENIWVFVTVAFKQRHTIAGTEWCLQHFKDDKIKLCFFSTVQRCSLEACSLHGKAINTNIQFHKYLYLCHAKAINPDIKFH